MNKRTFYPSSNRPVALGTNGMVTSAHPLASLAGQKILMEGGNAFDAIVATASTLNVVEPYMSGVGGIGLALVYNSKEGTVRSLDFSGRAPSGAHPDRFSNDSKETGILAPLIPGNLSGWLTIHESYGSMDRERLFQSAIQYAENGFPVTQLNNDFMKSNAGRLAKFPSKSIILDEHGRAPKPYSRLKMPELAASLRKIAKGGKEVFYKGELAEQIVKGNQELGGLFTMEDLASYEATWEDPINITYKGLTIYTTPPNSSGFQILQTLKLLEQFPDDTFIYQDPNFLHRFIESVKLCVTDRIKYGGDPDHVTIPVEGLISDDYARLQRERVNLENASVVSGEHFTKKVMEGSLKAGSPEEFDGGMTTHFAAADRDGNVVSITQTLGGGFGSAVAVGNTGIFLNNMSFWFDLEEGSPNRIGPNKRVDFVVAPTQTFNGDQFLLSMGTPGSWGILQTTPQFLMNVLDFGMNVQEAIEAPRLKVIEGRNIEMEERFPYHIRKALETKGHQIDTIAPWSPSVGGAHGIQFDKNNGVFQGGADPRRDGYAIGW